ncbi:zinc ribbon domain-containing protein [Prosthecobacter sp.]|uniref:zinc ribbon domain-containing protein n=1 Tax=Prosthecobacter sp. TaxID=1965333 RepID=UPI002ABA8245|nr:zinc ribbon domain-containing protein [Prosthecobacter sp.]MDZ4403180.1 zinc ribbon domain-containing protein [Prosthecobacter sp.]
MSTKLKQWGAVFIAYGVIALVLPSVTGMQLKIFNVFGENSTAAAIAAIVIGGVMWLIGMGSGGQTAVAGQAMADAAPAPPPPLPNVHMAAVPRLCPKCGAPATPADNFCMQCGTPVAPAAQPQITPAAPPPAPATKKGGGGCFKIGCLGLVVLIVAVVGLLFFGGGMGTYTAPPRNAPSVPPRMAGTLTEFPVDPAATNRMEPTSVVSQSFEPGASSSVAAQPNTLPPGLNTSSIPQSATTMTSTTYRSDPSSTPVNVHVLQSNNPNVAGQWAQGVAQSSGGQLQGTRLQSPQGQTYQGWSVRSATILVYILVNSNTGNIVILYTPQPAGFEATQRLAGSVGNGRGIIDYPQVVDTFGALPAYPPPGYNMTNMANFNGSELTSSLTQAQSGMDPQMVRALGQILQLIRMLIPERGTLAQYRNAQGQEKGLLIGNYGSMRKASIAYRVLSWTFGLAMKSSRAAGFEALTFSDSGGKAMIFQKGPYIGLTVVPGTSPDSDLADFARSVQF